MLVARNYFNVWPRSDLISAHTHIIFLRSLMMMLVGVAL